jgi:hypothetical protein
MGLAAAAGTPTTTKKVAAILSPRQRHRAAGDAIALPFAMSMARAALELLSEPLPARATYGSLYA